jgi:hypothetical protein
MRPRVVSSPSSSGLSSAADYLFQASRLDAGLDSRCTLGPQISAWTPSLAGLKAVARRDACANFWRAVAPTALVAARRDCLAAHSHRRPVASSGRSNHLGAGVGNE